MQYAVRLARLPEEIHAAQVLRFQVFNLELNEGLAQSYETGRDADPFDAVCDHLIVEHVSTHQIVGTYRLQMGGSGFAPRWRINLKKHPGAKTGSGTVCLVIASPAQPGVAIQLDGLLRRPLRGLLAMTSCTTTE